jgi:hypothetical protein
MGGFNPAWFISASMGVGMVLIATRDLSSRWKLGLRIVATVFFVAGLVGIGVDFYDAYLKAPDIQSPSGGFSYLTYWGPGSERYTAAVTVDTRPLVTFRETHYLLLLCRWEDSTVDALADTNVEKSREVSIADGEQVPIELKMSKKFADSYRGKLHYYLLLIPHDVPSSDVANIQGAIGRGGRILAHVATSPLLEQRPRHVRPSGGA